uniref:Uncharacterized protein n=1 Tax=Rhipicephalus zambeziensis TaxID=60191 RepID=A0A224YAX3_9ACAR
MYITDKHLPFSSHLFFPATFLQTMWFNSTQAQKRGSACITRYWATCITFKVSVPECFRVLELCTALQCSARVCCNCVACGVHVTNMHSYATCEVLTPLLLLLLN